MTLGSPPPNPNPNHQPIEAFGPKSPKFNAQQLTKKLLYNEKNLFAEAKTKHLQKMTKIALTSRDQSLLKKKIYNKVRKLTKWDSESKVRQTLENYRKLGEKGLKSARGGTVFDKKEMEPLIMLDRMVKGFEDYVDKNCGSWEGDRQMRISMKEGERVSFGRKMENLVGNENFTKENIGKIDRMLG
jgi:hypothetical protein